jgi:hypothetical protein
VVERVHFLHAEKVGPKMICAELEELEGQLDEIITALENPALTDEQRRNLENDYANLSHLIRDHQSVGHSGGPCYEE